MGSRIAKDVAMITSLPFCGRPPLLGVAGVEGGRGAMSVADGSSSTEPGEECRRHFGRTSESVGMRESLRLRFAVGGFEGVSSVGNSVEGRSDSQLRTSHEGCESGGGMATAESMTDASNRSRR